ncbi:MAG TPA: hypothetical protein VGL35_02120 [Rhizomicrobium sp.]|jgi:hypothetical protein
MAYETILFEVANGAARLTLNRPERLNSFTLAPSSPLRAPIVSTMATFERAQGKQDIEYWPPESKISASRETSESCFSPIVGACVAAAVPKHRDCAQTWCGFLERAPYPLAEILNRRWAKIVKAIQELVVKSRADVFDGTCELA